jgi:hypothetical protein
MKKMPLQCGRMASVAQEYCALIDGERDAGWIKRLETLLPRLHVAITALSAPSKEGNTYRDYDDEKRCELFLRLRDDLLSDQGLFSAYVDVSVGPRRRQQLCERMADDLADMYFDLKQGLEQLEDDPQCASEFWQYSFYLHWGKHLLDAEYWLRAVASGSEPLSLPEWQWPNASGLAASPA